jgi:hypothetical protein
MVSSKAVVLQALEPGYNQFDHCSISSNFSRGTGASSYAFFTNFTIPKMSHIEASRDADATLRFSDLRRSRISFGAQSCRRGTIEE